MAILDFSKTFDTVPLDRFLHKLDAGTPLLNWILNFPTTRKMRVVVDGEASGEADILSGVPQGTIICSNNMGHIYPEGYRQARTYPKTSSSIITRDYRSRYTGCVTKILKDLELPTLQQRRKELKLSFLYKVVEGMVPVITKEGYNLEHSVAVYIKACVKIRNKQF